MIQFGIEVIEQYNRKKNLGIYHNRPYVTNYFYILFNSIYLIKHMDLQ